MTDRKEAPYLANNEYWLEYLTDIHPHLGISPEILVFEGPPTAHCFGQRYVSLCHFGVHDEGKSDIRCVDASGQAWGAYYAVFRDYLASHPEASQIAWRVPPMLCGGKLKGSYIYSRLAVW